MGRRVNQILEGLPKARREEIEKRADRISDEMMAASLQELRQAAEKTQAQIAASMGLAQNGISQLEGRADLRLSTLNRYVEAVGGTVTVVVELNDGRRYRLRKDSASIVAAGKRAAPKQPASAAKKTSARHPGSRRAK